MPTKIAAKTAKRSKRKVFSKSLSQSFFDQIEIMFGKSSQYKDRLRFLKFLKQTIPAIMTRIMLINMNQFSLVIWQAL